MSDKSNVRDKAIRCKVCHKRPDEIYEYIVHSAVAEMIPENYVKRHEGTYNPKTGKFYCTDCYLKIGMPNGKA